MPERVRLASINVNGIRAAVRNGMGAWLDAADVDIITLQEVRATAADLAVALPGWQLVNDEATAKGRAGVAIASRIEPTAVRRGLGDDSSTSPDGGSRPTSTLGGEPLTVVSAYVHDRRGRHARGRTRSGASSTRWRCGWRSSARRPRSPSSPAT